MPPKRRIRQGSLRSPKQIKPPTVITNGNTNTNKSSSLTTNNTNYHLDNLNLSGNYSGGGSGGGVAVGTSTGDGGLTVKQQEQLNRNTYLSTLTKDQLKSECRRRGQKTTGTKKELLQRLGFKMQQQLQQHQQQQQQQQLQQQNDSHLHKTNSGYNKSKNQNNSNNNATTNGTGPTRKHQNSREKDKDRIERQKLVLWRHPMLTIKYASLELVIFLKTSGKKLLDHKIMIGLIIGLIITSIVSYQIPGQHKVFLELIYSNIWFIIYWVGLGVLSSVGFGTGLHTFLLYLGPHIASVTLAAYECNSLDFPQPPYPDEIICPEIIDPKMVMTIWSIMAKVRFEAFLWGAGTALGELPPYFIAKSARLTGYDADETENLQEIEELKKKRERGEKLSWLDRTKITMERLVERVGFLGILACASIPNPVFDLAGITCGHFLVPFWTFFGATLIGKAIIKMHIQQVFVIIAFNETLVNKTLNLLGYIPIFGELLLEPLKSFLHNQKQRLHEPNKNEQKNIRKSGYIIAKLYELIVYITISYFILSIVNSLAQKYHSRVHKKGAGTNKPHKKVAKD